MEGLLSTEFEIIFQVESKNLVLKTGKANFWCHPLVLDSLCNLPEKFFSDRMEIVEVEEVKGNNHNYFCILNS